MHACPKDTFLEHKPVGFRLPVTSLGENSFFKQLRFDSGNEEGGSSGGGGGGGGGADGPERAEAGGEGGGELSNEQIDPNKVAAIQRTTLDRLCRVYPAALRVRPPGCTALCHLVWRRLGTAAARHGLRRQPRSRARSPPASERRSRAPTTRPWPPGEAARSLSRSTCRCITRDPSPTLSQAPTRSRALSRLAARGAQTNDLPTQLHYALFERSGRAAPSDRRDRVWPRHGHPGASAGE